MSCYRTLKSLNLMRNTITILCAAFLLSGIAARAQHTDKCATEEHNNMLRATNPNEYDAARQTFEANWQAYATANTGKNNLSKKADKIIIPVVVHIFHNYGSENISDAQVAMFIDHLNKHYNADPGLVSVVRPVFRDDIANCNFEFRLVKKDPNGNCTNGIVRVQTPLTYKASNAIKALSTWDTRRYLNVWVAASVYSNGKKVGGYAQYPYSGLPSTDGLLVESSPGSIFGNTVAHEIGHAFGLIHPFEGSDNDSCSNGDGVDDTPRTYYLYATGGVNSGRGNFCGNPDYNTCGNETPDRPDMQENIMDYFEGPCAGVMFTHGQEARMRYCIENYRTKLVSQENLISTGVLDPAGPCAPVAAFGLRAGSLNTFGRSVCRGVGINFIDQSYNGTPTSWEWNFGEGATPATSSAQNPVNVLYSTTGPKTVTLKVSNSQGENMKTYTNLINVVETSTLNYHAYTPDYPLTAEGWELIGDNEGVNWQVTNNGVFSGERSIMLPGNNSPVFSMFGKQYSVVSPYFDLSAGSSPYLSFKYAFARNYYPGSTTSATNDTLRIEASTDCGLSWTKVRSDVGAAALSTISSAALPYSVNFIPVNQDTTTAGQWKEISINLTSNFRKPNIRFRIQFVSGCGNNFYLDDIRIGQNTGLNKLTREDIGLNIYPNPFSTTTQISYTLPQASQVSVEVFDIVGRKMAALFEGKQAEGRQELLFDRLPYGLGSGMYFVKINIGNSSITHKVLVN
jgi:PKD repeat protein